MRASQSAESLERFHQVFEKSPNAYLLLSPDFTILACNEAYERHVGRLREHLVGRPLFEVFPVANPAQRERLQASLAWVFRERRRHTVPPMRYPVAHVATLANDTHAGRFWTVTHVPILNAAGEVECVLSHPTDIAELTRLRCQDAAAPAHGNVLAQAEPPAVQWVSGMQHLSLAERQYLQQLFKQAPGFVCVLQGPQHVVELANDAFHQLVGHRPVLQQVLAHALPEVEEQGFLALLNNVLASGEPTVCRALPLALQRERDGPREPRYIDLVFQPIREPDGRVSGVFVQGHDVTDAHELAQALAYQAAHDALTGLLNRREFGQQVAGLLARARQASPAASAAALTDCPSLAVPAVPLVPMLAPQAPAWSRDTAWGLSGRHMLLYLDLDQFKIVNDQWGHAAGDELLRQVAACLQRQVRDTDILARVGGDEFALVLCDCPEDAALRIAQQLRQAIDGLVFMWRGQRYGVSLSVGLVAFGPALGLGLELALSHADAACLLAKEKGRNRLQVYHAAHHELDRRHREMGWVARLQSALADDRVVLYAQRIFALQPGLDGQVTWELLARLREPGSGVATEPEPALVMPAAFIPAAERFGLMPAFDRHVLRKAFEHLHHLPARLRYNTRYFVNVSGTTLNQGDFAPYVQTLLSMFPRVMPQQVCFEVTETAAVSNLQATASAMQQLVEQGFRFALDDFGSGMASFAYLRQLPVQYVKIDGEFVRDVLEDPIDDAMVQAVANVARTMGIHTVAEFVESRGIMERLVVLGVDYGQGYGLEYPQPLSRITAYEGGLSQSPLARAPHGPQPEP